MKKSLFPCCVCLLITFSVSAQDWNLVVAGGKYNFGTPGSAIVSNTIIANAISATNGDSVFLLSPQRAIGIQSNFFAVLIGSFIGDTVIKHPDFVYEFRFKPPTYTVDGAPKSIHARAEVGDTWEFKSGVTATVTEKKDTTWWNTADSLKTILLSNGTKIRLSKNFGLLFLNAQTLIGLEGQDVGVQLPTLADFYSDWVGGAVFETYHYNRVGSNSAHTLYEIWTKYYVLGKTITPDSILIDVHKLVKTVQYSSFLTNTQLDTITYKNAVGVLAIPNPQKVEYPGGVNQFGLFLTSVYTPVSAGVKLDIQNIQTAGASSAKHITYETGIGETLNYYEHSAGNSNRKLNGYQKIGQAQHGTIHPDSFYGVVSSSQEVVDLKQLSAFPNPATDVIYIRCEDCPQATGAVLMKATGQIVRTEHFNGAGLSMQTRDLPNGQYILQVHFENGATAIRKILVR